MPDLSRIAGDPNAPAERTTRRDVRATTGLVAPLAFAIVSSTYSIPTARVPLQKLKLTQTTRRRTHTQK